MIDSIDTYLLWGETLITIEFLLFFLLALFVCR
jgi:hypothetical protein